MVCKEEKRSSEIRMNRGDSFVNLMLMRLPSTSTKASVLESAGQADGLTYRHSDEFYS